MGEQICFARPFSCTQVWRKGRERLLIGAEEKVVGRVGHQNLLAHVASNQTAGCRSRSAFRVKTLNECSLGQRPSTCRTLSATDGLQQQTVNRTAVRTTRVGPSGDEILFLGPYPAAVKRALPCYISKTRRIGTDSIGILDRTQEVGDDLERLAKDIREERGFGACIVYGPGRARACRQANVALRAHTMPKQESRISFRR